MALWLSVHIEDAEWVVLGNICSNTFFSNVSTECITEILMLMYFWVKRLMEESLFDISAMCLISVLTCFIICVLFLFVFYDKTCNFDLFLPSFLSSKWQMLRKKPESWEWHQSIVTFTEEGSCEPICVAFLYKPKG